MIVDISYYNVLHIWISICAIPCSIFNLFGLYAIFMATPKRLNYYMYYLLGYQLCCIVFDFGGAIIEFPVFSFPAKCAFIIGVASFLGIPTQLQGTLAVIITLTMLSILGVAIFQRQQSILPTEHPLAFSRNLSICAHIFMLGHPFLITIFVVYFFVTTDSDLGTQQNLQLYPELEQFLLQPSSVCADASFGENVSTLPLIYLALIIVIGFWLVAPTYWSLYKQRKIMSAKTLALQKKWLRNLNIQVFLFTFVIILPVIWWIAVYQLSLISLAGLNFWATYLAIMHGTLNTCALFVFYDSYQKFLLLKIEKLLSYFFKEPLKRTARTRQNTVVSVIGMSRKVLHSFSMNLH